MKPVSFHRVQVTDNFWKPRMETNSKTTLKIQYKHLKETGRIDSLEPEYKKGDREAHHIFWDSDIAKWIESGSYSLHYFPDEELEEQIDDVIDKYARLQLEDGYLNSWYIKVEPEKRWTNLRDNHELYCAGHLMEAAVAYYQVTGKKRFLDIMCRYADHIDSVFGPEEGKKRGYPGHEEIELALVKLYQVTNNERYLNLAKFFIDERGAQPHYYDQEALERGENPERRRPNYEYSQSHLPVREQNVVVGHAVRAMYLYSGMVDVGIETNDPTLLEACSTLWDNLTQKRMYITGGIGASNLNEGFTFDYDFPEETSYCETCASVGLIFWGHRMLQYYGDNKYGDVVERALFNGAISGISLSGDRFFYANPLASLGHRHRSEWFGCACCPPNISRLIASVGGYIYSEADDSAWVHQFIQSSTELNVASQKVHIEQRTNYPWSDKITFFINPERPAKFTLYLRVPSWTRSPFMYINGEMTDVYGLLDKGYVKIERTWSPGDSVELILPMPVERIWATPFARLTNGRIALQRGPIVYCLEEVDNPYTPLSRLSLPRSSKLTATFEEDLLGGVMTIKGLADVIETDDWDANEPYRLRHPIVKPVTIKAIPYYAWDNREPGHMIVWLRETF